MITHFIEATNEKDAGCNWGKFMVARFTKDEWSRRSAVDSSTLLAGRGWTPDHILVFDLQTGEGALFQPGGIAHYDLEKHKILVCPMFEPFLIWLYKQDLNDLAALPKHVDVKGESALAGYRRPGKSEQQEGDRHGGS